jgi:hypothetical protein
MSPYEFVKLQQEQGVSELSQTYLANGVTLDDYKNVEAIDWQKKLYRNARMMDHNLSITGGSVKRGTAFRVIYSIRMVLL